MAIQAGCDGVLICRHLSKEPHNDINVQAAALEALVHAVEDGVSLLAGSRTPEAAASRQGNAFLLADWREERTRSSTSSLRRAPACRDEMTRFLENPATRPAMIRPPALHPGSRIALVSPASPFQREEFDKGVAELRRLGFEPAYHDTVFDRARSRQAPPSCGRRRLSARGRIRRLTR
jgi:hypothetical protein